MTNIFLDFSWSGPLLWVLIYISDYSLTLACARMYKAQDIIKFEGSFELTPAFQKDIDALNRFSPRFLLAISAATLLLFLSWFLAVKLDVRPELYLVTLGVLIFSEAAVHMRHIHNWYFYRKCAVEGGIKGHIEYPRSTTLRISSVELFSYAILFLIIFLLTYNWLFLGGAAGCASIAFRHNRMAKYQAIKTAAS